MATETKKTAAKKAPAKKAVAKKAPAEKTPVSKAEKVVVSVSEAEIFSMQGEKKGTIALPPELFAVAWKPDLVHQVVVGMEANARPVTAHTKDRSEVSGGGKKPWKQKGTGRARHGSTRSPIWKGGGVTHGPRAEKIYAVKINKKMRSAALASVLSKKLKDGEIIFVDSLAFTAPKTKEAVAALGAIAKAANKSELKTKRKNAAIIALAGKDKNIEKSFSNIGSLITQEARNLNPVDLVHKKFLVIERPEETFKVLLARVTHTG